MKLKTLSYEEVHQRHRDELSQVVAQLRGSKSKWRDLDPRELVWSYDCSVAVSCHSWNDLLSGEVAKDDPWRLSAEMQVKDLEKRTNTQLVARKGQWYGSIDIPNPPEVLEWVSQQVRGRMAQQAASDAMSDTEREQAVSECLQNLGKGLVAIQVRKKVSR